MQMLLFDLEDCGATPRRAKRRPTERRERRQRQPVVKPEPDQSPAELEYVAPVPVRSPVVRSKRQPYTIIQIGVTFHVVRVYSTHGAEADAERAVREMVDEEVRRLDRRACDVG